MKQVLNLFKNHEINRSTSGPNDGEVKEFYFLTKNKIVYINNFYFEQHKFKLFGRLLVFQDTEIFVTWWMKVCVCVWTAH